MALTEESRYQLFQRFEELLGPEKMATLMELHPPVGWADVATKRDLDHLEERLDARIDRLGVELRAEMFREQRNQTLAIIAANSTITAALLGTFHLL